MIRLEKLDKPNILNEKDIEWTRDLMSYYNKGEKIPEALNKRYGHREIKSKLIEETSHKCAYCESKITAIDYGDIEHIEPKSQVPNRTFDWDNLTLACRKCNQNKGRYYSLEEPLLNPYLDPVEEEIIFLGPVIFTRTDRAQLTVKLLKLDRPELFERRTSYIKNIQPLIDTLTKTENETLRNIIYLDILKYTDKEKEYSAMMKSVVSAIMRSYIAEVG